MSKLKDFLDNSGPISYDEQKKKEFKKLGLRFIKDVIKILYEDLEEFSVNYNQGGIAVSGDYSLCCIFKNKKGACVFLNADVDFVTLRSITGLKDFKGGNNINVSREFLSDPNKVASKLKEIARVE